MFLAVINDHCRHEGFTRLSLLVPELAFNVFQINFPRSQQRNRIDAVNILSFRNPELGQIRLIEFFPQFVCAHPIGCKKRSVFHLVAHRGQRSRRCRFAKKRVDGFLDYHMGDHFPADLTETRYAVRDAYEAIFVQGSRYHP